MIYFPFTPKLIITTIIIFFCVSLGYAQTALHSHANNFSDPRGTIEVDWELPNISKVVTAAWGFSFGIESYPRKGFPVKTIVENKICQTGSYFSFDVDDSLYYDIDEDITLTLLLRDEGSKNFTIAYDRNVASMAQVTVSANPIGNGWYKAVVVLSRARFVNRGHAGTDFTIFAAGANPFDLKLDETHTLTISEIEISKSGESQPKRQTGNLRLTIVDENNHQTPARVGIYSTDTDWMPMPSEDAIQLTYMTDQTNQLFLRSVGESIEVV